ncbi:respiratory nitrate reductase 2 alpha chain [Escherichia coli]|uniref:Respiratory nitrate reductase 2 alpha chain n=1 Tax=Escherichia coli TaxID=562 RepID=A0A377A2S9_ECOLX|nr:respiratory nitrate reductase 2 alpha chain [Escherichia coli]
MIELWREASNNTAIRYGVGIDYERSAKVLSYKQVRGRGGFIRSNWQELNQLIAAANV